jgi:hypothetical protein
MSSNQPAIPLAESIGEPRLRRIFDAWLENYPSMTGTRRERADEALIHFLAAQPPLIALLLKDGVIARGCPEFASALLRRGFRETKITAEFQLLADLALKHGLADALQSPDSARPSRSPGVVFTPSQSRTFAQLQRFAALQFGNPQVSGISLRTNPLIVGPSGVGKTHLVRELGATLQIPVLKFTIGDWIPVGARAGTPTLTVLHNALLKPGRLIVHLDELDKLQGAPESPWMQSIFTEAFCILDRQPGAEWRPEQVHRLRREVLIVGSGTWQDLWEIRDKPAAGFSAPTATRPTMADRIRRSRVIPPELLNRFADQWLFLEPYCAEDFRRIAAALHLSPEILDPEAAARSGLNFRAIENALTTHALLATNPPGFADAV